MPDVSILIPHYHSDTAARALKATVPVLIDNTTLDYELVITAHLEREFIAWNGMALRASADWLILMVSDVFVAAGWDVALWDTRDKNTISMLTLIEGGYLGQATFSINGDYGQTPETFRASEFEAFAATCPQPPDLDCWAFPWLINRQRFLERGGFQINKLDSQMTDRYFVVDWQDAGLQICRAPGYGYHLVAWTLTGEER